MVTPPNALYPVADATAIGLSILFEREYCSFGIAGVTDGTSNTACFSEKLMGTAGYGNSSGASTITASMRNQALRECLI